MLSKETIELLLSLSIKFSIEPVFYDQIELTISKSFTSTVNSVMTGKIEYKQTLKSDSAFDANRIDNCVKFMIDKLLVDRNLIN